MSQEDKIDLIAAILLAGAAGADVNSALIRFRALREQLMTEGLDRPKTPARSPIEPVVAQTGSNRLESR